MLDAGHRPSQNDGMDTQIASFEFSRHSAALSIAKYVASLLMVAAATLIGLMISMRWGNAPVVMLYLPPVLASAIYCGLTPALMTATVSTLAYNYYFTAPFRTFFIHSPTDIVTVVVLFLVAVVTSQLAASLREQAKIAAAHAARNATIAGFARRLLSCDREQAIADVTVQELSTLFGCHAVFAVDRGEVELLAGSPDISTLAPSDMAAVALTFETGEVTGRGVQRVSPADWQFHPVTSNETRLAAIGVAREDGSAVISEEHVLLFGNLLDQVALALERARLEKEARASARLHERDGLRSALLASIGEDIKPRLNSIGQSVRALKRDSANSRELLSAIATETTRLDRYIDNLVELSPGAEQKPIKVGPLSIDLHNRTVSRSGEQVHLTPKEYALLAELAKHRGRVLPHTQLLRTVWGPAHDEHIDYLRVAIRSLRQKLEDQPDDPQLILNEPAVGYRLAFNANQ